MGTFTPAGFTFGDSIVKERMQKRQIQAEMERASQQAALQIRGQNIQRDQANANREEAGRQFDARLAESEAARADAAAQREAELAERGAVREESARQFDERMAREDQKREDELADKKHKQSWDDALKQQQIEAEDMKYQKWQAELEELLAKGRRDQEEYEAKVQAQKELRESALGMVSEGVLLSGPLGGFTPSQVQHFNEKFGQQFDAIGRRDMTTGKQYEDGLIHLIQYAKDDKGNILYGFQDENGNTVEDPQRKNPNSQPLVVQDQSISKDDYEFGLGRLREYGGRAAKGGGSGLEIAKINAESKRMAEEGRERRFRRGQELKEDKFALEVNKDANKAASEIFSGLSEAEKKSFHEDYKNFVLQMKEKYAGKTKGGEGDPSPDGSGQEIDVSGARNKEEFNKILSEAPEGAILSLKGETRVKRNGEWVVVKK